MRILKNPNAQLSALKNGNIKAFDDIFRKYYPVLCAYGNRFVELEDAKEIAEDALLLIWEQRDFLEIQTSLGAYLIKIVYYKAINRIKRNNLKNVADTQFYTEMLELMSDDNFVGFQELTQNVKQAIDALPETYRQAFLMHRFQNKTYKEIAEELGVSPKTIDYRIQQSLKLLKIALKDYFYIAIMLYPYMHNNPYC